MIVRELHANGMAMWLIQKLQPCTVLFSEDIDTSRSGIARVVVRV